VLCELRSVANGVLRARGWCELEQTAQYQHHYETLEPILQRVTATIALFVGCHFSLVLFVSYAVRCVRCSQPYQQSVVVVVVLVCALVVVVVVVVVFRCDDWYSRGWKSTAEVLRERPGCSFERLARTEGTVFASSGRA
jgi:hypothetical protein